MLYSLGQTVEHAPQEVFALLFETVSEEKSMGLTVQIFLLQHSTRFWTYRPPQGWVFDELTGEERNRLRESGVHSIKRHGLLTTDGTIRLPTEVPVYFSDGDTEGLSRWLARCTLTDLSPFVPSHFQLIRGESSWHRTFKDFSFDKRGHLIFDPMVMPMNKFVYSHKGNRYFSWLWDDEVAFYQSLGSGVAPSDGFGWESFSPPTARPSRTPPMYSYIYALIDCPLTHKMAKIFF